MKTINDLVIRDLELGYTIVDCYSGNANYGYATQKQYVVHDKGELKNIFLKGFVNGPADDGRDIVYYKLADITAQQMAELQEISNAHQEINWNTGRYSVYTKLLSDKDYAAIKEAESAYIKILMTICQPVNDRAKAATMARLKEFIKPFLPPSDFSDCGKYFFIF